MRTIFFDVETQYSAAEVGGWTNVPAMRISVACTYDDERGYRDWWEAQASDLIETLRDAELIVGFNIGAFDYHVLSLYGDVSGLFDKSFDIHDEIFQQAHKRVSLNSLAVMNLGEAKMLESGVQAIRLWRTGRREELVAYCRRDVELTRRLFGVWEDQGVLWLGGVEFVTWPGIKTAEALAERWKELEEEKAG
jgi:DEAD/DEAH box helicase domain-containing protein